MTNGTPLVLVTGFAPFPGAPENPTQWLIENLTSGDWRPANARVETLLLPTTFAVFGETLEPAIRAFKPAAVVSFGLSAKARGFTLERVAKNAVATDRPDTTGARARDAFLDAGGPGQCGSALPLDSIARRLEEAGLPWAWSDDAGDYLCNLVFYRTRRALPPAPTGFIHVPYLDSQKERLAARGEVPADLATMSEAQLLKGARIIVSAVADSLP